MHAHQRPSPVTQITWTALCVLALALPLAAESARPLLATLYGNPSIPKTQKVSSQDVEVVPIYCSPKRLKESDTLLLHMRTPHGRDLAVIDPDKRFHFVVFWRADTTTPAPLVDWEAFSGMAELRLSIANLEAPAVDTRGWHAPAKVFTKRGTYRILLGINLETERERGGVTSCVLFFEGIGSQK
jgi:hypothetical protein